MEEAKEKPDSASVKILSPLKTQNAKGASGDEIDIDNNVETSWNYDVSPSKVLKEVKVTPTHSKKVIKHALRQQAKRRRKNTTIAAGNSAPIQRLSLSPHCELEEISNETACYRQPTMAEVLSSIPGFSIKPRKRSNKKLSAAAQLEQTKEGCVDLETPDSILVNSNLRSLLNKHTFHSLPPLYQYKLLQLLPHVDRVPVQSESMFRLSNSGLNNEFFARACLDWRERLAEGEFTIENQAKLKAEQEKEKSKLDPWKLKHFEPMWGESLREWPSLPPGVLAAQGAPIPQNPPVTRTSTQNHHSPNSVVTKIPNDIKNSSSKLVSKANVTSKVNHSQQQEHKPPPIIRTVGAVTRAVTSYREKRLAEESSTNQNRPNKRTRPQEKFSKGDAGSDKELEKNDEIPERRKSNRLENEKLYVKTQPEINQVGTEVEETHKESANEVISVADENLITELIIGDQIEISCKDEEANVIEITVEPDEVKETVVSNDISEVDTKWVEEKKDIEMCSSPLHEVQIVEFEHEIVEEVVRGVVEEVEQQMRDEGQQTSNLLHIETESVSGEKRLCLDDEDKTAEEKTLGDLVALQEEVADRIELSVKAEALQKAQSSLEEWEIIKVDPNQEGETSSGLPTPGDADDLMSSTSNDLDRNKNQNYYGDILYQETLKDEAALLAAAWDVVGSSTEFQDVNLNQPVSVIPCQEELEVRLQESSLPVPQWEYTSSQSKQPHGHVKLELEVTLTPEVDSQVSSTVEQLPSMGSCGSSDRCSPVVSSGETGTRTSTIQMMTEEPQTGLSAEAVMSIQQAQPPPHVTVIPPTTIVCLPPPPLFSTQANTHTAPPIRPPPQNHNTSSSAIPFIALTTSTPVRALPTKTVSKSGAGSGGGRGGGGRNSNKPPPGAVNLERSYQICQAVIQNSPNRHQLRCQLKPPPSLLLNKSTSGGTSVSNVVRNSTGNNTNRHTVRQGVRQTQQHQVLLKHVFTSSHGIPVNMAVLPPQHNQIGEYMMVQRGVQVRRSNSAPPSNVDSAGSGLVHRGGRPASVGGPRPPASESAPPPPPLPPPVAPPPSYHHLIVPQQNTSSCPCSLKAMIACVKCGAFCHDDCITPHSRLCITCDTR